MVNHKQYDFSVNDVSEVYAGPGGKLWELLMGEQIHVGGPEQTDLLAKKADIDKAGKNFTLLDICSALGGPARHLAEKYGINVVGLDITPEMVLEAKKRTEGKPYANKIEYRIGSGLDIPAHQNSFEVVWGQDAWCYVRDKVRLIEETWRVLKPGGTLAFTDWIWGPENVSEKESDFLMEFMVFPNLQTLNGYVEIIESVGYKIVEKQDLQEDFAKHMDIYVDILQKAKPDIEAGFGKELYVSAEEGVLAWQKGALEKKVGRGLWIAKKP
jgi:SAM-dependent methyltransferase